MTITGTIPAAYSDAVAYRAETEAITRAKTTLAQAEARTWTGEAAEAVRGAAGAVRDAIEIHEALRAGVLCWEAYDPDIREYAEQSRHSIAEDKSAEDAEELAGLLAEVTGRYAAHDVNGISEGEQS